ncbi:MAG: hypothetical protein AAF414_11910, partial [Pseudomonadota bacterium]
LGQRQLGRCCPEEFSSSFNLHLRPLPGPKLQANRFRTRLPRTTTKAYKAYTHPDRPTTTSKVADKQHSFGTVADLSQFGQ